MDNQGQVCIADFYNPDPPPIFLQGDVLEDVPRIQIAKPENIPAQLGAPDELVVGPASYSSLRAMIISPSCNIPEVSGGFIQVAMVEPRPGLSNDVRIQLQKARLHRRFLLPEHPEYGEQIVQLTDIWSVDRAHIDDLPRILSLSHWARSLLVDALYRAFCRPIINPMYDLQEPQPFPRGTMTASP